jgi:coenzyme PQQ biosynthesis protein PqqD
VIERPQLRNGVRLEWEHVRGKHMLLYPEGALALNETAAAVLELCDGERRVAAIASVLSERYGGADVEADVRELLVRIAERGLVVDADA